MKRPVLSLVLITILCIAVTMPAADAATIGRLARSTGGTLGVDSSPQGAAVFVDGTRAGTTPLTGYSVSAGTHTILLTLAGYQDFTSSVEVGNGQDIAVAYRMTSARAVTTTTPVRAAVSLSGQLVKITTQPGKSYPVNNAPWITGTLSTSTLHCPDPDYSVTFSGGTGNIPAGDLVTLKILDHPDNINKTLPATGVVIGTAPIAGDGSWKLAWNGIVPGNGLISGQQYVVQAIPPNGQYTKMGFTYQCADEQPSITGTVSANTVTCTKPGNTVVLKGWGKNLATGTTVTYTIFNVPPGTAQDLPASGVVIGTTQVQADDSWTFTWKGGVPGYSLTPGKSYLVRASISPALYFDHGIQYECPPGSQWFMGTVTSPNITCTQPNTTLMFFGSSGNISEGTPLSITIYDYPGASPKQLPDAGVFLGTTTFQSDKMWRFNWTGAVPGYSLTYGKPYLIIVRLTDTNYLKFGVEYLCQPGTVPAAAFQPVAPSGLQQIPANQYAGPAGGESGMVPAGGSAIGGDGVAVSPHLNPQPEPPSPISGFFEFITGLFGGKTPAKPPAVVNVAGPTIPPGGTIPLTYYTVAPEIRGGATVYIGEQNLDLTKALNGAAGTPLDGVPPITTIGIWQSGLTMDQMKKTHPIKSVNLGSQYSSFTIDPATFVGYTGTASNWYPVDPQTGGAYMNTMAGPLLLVTDPQISLAVTSAATGNSVDGTSVPAGSQLRFSIQRNIGVKSTPASLRTPITNTADDGFMDIVVTSPDGKILQDLDVTTDGTPGVFSLRRVCWDKAAEAACTLGTGTTAWNTGAKDSNGNAKYKPGVYTVQVISKLNNMHNTYRNAGQLYTGHTASQKISFTLT
ncbi:MULTISPECIES: DUF3821 domain-containing protein [unclassified Methanoregula]|uniref:DUF3821 domain-containing protein n=1 Tax=unclassified Methanoregula TaxID=2649730 RepID=UPI0009C6A1CC|nr:MULTISPECIES: DUF3821 domain-containing protein [unclassified Methanoregula]OPX61796.1 MAG: PEGA domain protein [Methanoregula sp. PtaB.Bin085]OPY33894.1 MAG: PEGA domain protein [Methanoregula sp. PtaU1.Bin006]